MIDDVLHGELWWAQRGYLACLSNVSASEVSFQVGQTARYDNGAVPSSCKLAFNRTSYTPRNLERHPLHVCEVMAYVLAYSWLVKGTDIGCLETNGMHSLTT